MKRFLSLMIAAIMVVSMVPTSFASELDGIVIADQGAIVYLDEATEPQVQSEEESEAISEIPAETDVVFAEIKEIDATFEEVPVDDLVIAELEEVVQEVVEEEVEEAPAQDASTGETIDGAATEEIPTEGETVVGEAESGLQNAATMIQLLSVMPVSEDADTTAGVADETALAAALQAGGEIVLAQDITLDTAITVPDGATIDLNGHTLYVNVENSYYNNATIKNGCIVLGKDDVHVCDGYFLVNEGKTLVLNGVQVSSSAEGIKGYAVFHLKTGANLDLIGSKLTISNNEYSAGYIVYANEATATVDVADSTITGSNTNGIVHATTTISDSSFTVNPAVEHGINRSAVTIDDSNITISGGTGRGITAQHGDLVITGNSNVSITNMGEATIELRGDKNLSVAEAAKVTLDAAINNTTSGTITGEVVVKVPAAGNIGPGVVTDDATVEGDSYIYFDLSDMNATESIEIKLYSGDTFLSSTVLNDVGKGKGYLSSASLSAKVEITDESSSWDTTWAVEPISNVIPNKAVLYIDGVEVATTTDIRMYNTDYSALAREWKDIEGVKAAPEGTITPGYITTPDVAATASIGIWGEATFKGTESFVVELYAGDTLIATSKLNDNDKVLLTGEQKGVTWNIRFPNCIQDEWWFAEWEDGHPNVNTQPTKVVLYIDGVRVAENVVKMSAADDLNKGDWDKIEAIQPKVAQIGDVEYATFAEAVAAIATDGSDTTIKLLKDIEVPGDIEFKYGTGKVIFTADTPVIVKQTALGTDFDFVEANAANIVIEKNVTFEVYDNSSGIYLYYGPSLTVNGAITGGQNWGVLYLFEGEHSVSDTGKIGTGRVQLGYTKITVEGEIDTNYLLVEKSSFTADGAIIDAGVIYDNNNGSQRWGASEFDIKNGSEVIAGSVNLSYADSKLTIDMTSKLTAGSVTGAGTIVIDATGYSEGAECPISGDASAFTGKIDVINNDYLEAKVDENGKIMLIAKPVAKVGNTEYGTINDAIANWTKGTTLTLLADVTLSDVVTLKSTEHHILDLGVYTMTAASGKHAIEITCEGQGTATYALTVKADTENPGGITATGKSCIYYRKSDTTKDRPIIQINGGVFNGSYAINVYSSNRGTNCPQVNITSGVFNGNVNIGHGKLMASGGTFNGWVNCTGDSTAYRQISGGTYKSWQFMTADATNKFWVGTSQANYDVGVYVDDNGYLVVGGPVITEAGETFEASSTNCGGWSSYLKYSSAAANGLYYTSAAEALADNNKAAGIVTLYTDKLDLSSINYKGTINLPEATSEFAVTFAEGTTPAWTVVTEAEGKAVSYTDSTENGVVTRTYSIFTPVAQVGEKQYATVLEAIEAAIASRASEVKILTNSKELLTNDQEILLTADLTITADAEVKVEFYNNGTSYDLIFNSNEENNEVYTLTIGKNVTMGLSDRIIWIGYYGNNVDVVVNGTLSGKQIWHGADTTVSSTGKLISSGEAMVLRRGATLNVDGGTVDANYFSILAGNIQATNATIVSGPVWVSNTGNYIYEGNVSIELDNTEWTSSGNLKLGSAESAMLKLTNGSKLSATGTEHGASAIDAKSTIIIDKSSELVLKKLTGAGTITADAANMSAGDVVAVSGDLSDFTGTPAVINNDKLEASIVDNKIVLSEKKLIEVTYADGTVEYFADMLEAVPYTTNCPRLEGATVKLLADIDAPGIRLMENDMVLDLNGFTYTITDGTGSQGTNTSGFQIRPEITTSATIKNGKIQVAEGAPVVWMFNVYATDFIVANVVVDCANMAWSYGTSCYVVVSRAEDNVQFTGDTQILNFDAGVAGSAINVGGTMTIEGSVVPGGQIELDAGATLTAREGLDVVTADGYVVVYKNGRYTTAVAVAKVNDVLYASLADAISAAADGDTITLLQDVEIAERLYLGSNSAFDKIAITFDGNGKTIKAVGESWNDNTWLADIAWNVTLKNVTFDGNNTGCKGVQFYTSQSTLNNVTIKNISADKWGWTDYALHGNASDLTIEGALTFEGCKHGHMILDMGNNTGKEATTAKLADGAELSGVNVIFIHAAASLTGPEGMIIECAVQDHKVVYENGAYKVVAKVYVAQTGEVKYETLQAAIDAAQDGDTVTIVAAGEYTLPNNIEKKLTIKGYEQAAVIIKMEAKERQPIASVTDLTLESLTINRNNVDYAGFHHSTKETYVDCVINGEYWTYAQEASFTDCVFNQTSANDYNLWTYGSPVVKLTNCTFNCAGKSVLVYNEGVCATDLTATGCAFAASAPVEGKAAIEIDTTLMPDGTDIVINNCTATGFAEGSVSGETLWNDKKDQTDLTVTVDGVLVWPIPELPTATVTEIENEELTFALNFKADDATDAQLNYYGDWYADFVLTVNKNVTFNADGTADGYLSGQYDAYSENWVNVPLEDVTLMAGESIKIMEYAAGLMDEPGLRFTYEMVYDFVKDFDCGVYFSDEYLLANPDLVVTLELRMYNNVDETESYAIGETYTFNVPYACTIGSVGYATLADAVAEVEAGADATITVLKDHATAEVRIADDADITIDLSGNTVNGYIAPFEGTLTVKNGSIENYNSSASAIEINAGTLTLEAVDIISARHAVRIDGEVTATINGGTYQVTGEKTSYAVNVSGEANVTIKGGIFKGPKGTPNGAANGGSAISSRDTAVVTIEGGAFSGGVNDTLYGASETNIVVTGGTFDQDPSTYVAEGYKAVTADEQTWTVIEKELWDIEFVQMVLGNALDMRFAFSAEHLDDWTGTYAVATKVFADGRADVVQTIPNTDWKKAEINNAPYYYFTFNDISGKEMSDNIYVTVYNAEGEAISNEYSESVKTYVARALNTTNQYVITMLVDMLNYGAAAQNFYQYGTDDLATSLLTDEQKACATKEIAKCENSQVKGEKYLGTRLELKNSINMQMVFEGLTTDMTAKIELTNHRGTQISETVHPIVTEDNYTVVDIDQIVVADGRQDVSITVYDTNGKEYGSATDSIESYVARVAADPLYEMIMKFSESAKAYLHS